MSKADQLKEVRFVKDHVLRLRFEDGVEHLADFGPYFRDFATAGERRYGGSVRFKKFKLVGSHALEWGDAALVFSAERLRRWQSTGVVPARSKVAA